MNLFIQIPCLNEQKTISKVIESLPKKIKGIKKIEVVLLDDGSTDNTVSIVKKKFPKVKVISNFRNLGLAETFKKGINFALSMNADIIVNTDGDNQYKGSDIIRLIKPIIIKKKGIAEGADYVIGERKFNKVKSFSTMKKILQYFGNFIMQKIINIETNDVTSGFRAYNREAASKIFYTNNFTYTIESLIHITDSKLVFKGIDIDTNKVERKSRLFKSNYEYIAKTALIVLKTLAVKKPLQIFSAISVLFFLVSLFFFREYFMISMIFKNEHPLTANLLFGTTFLIVSLQALTIGIISFLSSKILYINLEILSKIKLQKKA